MKIKNSLLALVAMIGTIVTMSAASTSAQQTVPTTASIGGYQPPTSEQIADGFAIRPAKYYRIESWFDGVTNNIATRVEVSGLIQNVRGHWGITQLRIGDKDLPIDPQYPIWELPEYVAGEIQNFYLRLYGYNDSDEITRFGYFNKPKLARGEEIKVTINLNSVRKVIAYKLPTGRTGKNTGIASGDGRYQGYYDTYLGAFVVYFDPLSPPEFWVLTDLTNGGAPFGEHIPFGGGGGQGGGQSNGFGLILENQDGLKEMMLDSSEAWYQGNQGITSDKVVTRGGTNYYGKYQVVRLARTTDYLQTYIYGLKVGSVVEIHKVKDDGVTLQLISTTKVTEWWYTEILNTTGSTAYKIVVIGLPQDLLNGYSIQCYDTTNEWGPSGGGLGKDVAPMVLGQ